MSTIICEFCESCVSKHNIAKHKKSESCLKIQKILDNTNDKIKTIEEQQKLKLLEQENKIQELTQLNNTLKTENNSLKTEIKILEKSTEEYCKIVENLSIKSVCFVLSLIS